MWIARRPRPERTPSLDPLPLEVAVEDMAMTVVTGGPHRGMSGGSDTMAIPMMDGHAAIPTAVVVGGTATVVVEGVDTMRTAVRVPMDTVQCIVQCTVRTLQHRVRMAMDIQLLRQFQLTLRTLTQHRLHILHRRAILHRLHMHRRPMLLRHSITINILLLQHRLRLLPLPLQQQQHRMPTMHDMLSTHRLPRHQRMRQVQRQHVRQRMDMPITVSPRIRIQTAIMEVVGQWVLQRLQRVGLSPRVMVLYRLR